MIFKLTVISFVLFITTLVNLFVTIISWQRRNTRVGRIFFFAMAAITLWTLAACLDYAAVPDQLKIFFAQIESIGYNSALALFAMVSVIIAGHEKLLEKPWVKVFFILLPSINILLALTDPLHGWVWSGFRRNPFGDNVLIFEHGPGFAWLSLNNYLMVAIILINLWQAARGSSQITRRQAYLLIPAMVVPLIFNTVYLLGIPQFEGIDLSSIAFSITSLIFLVGLQNTRLLDLAPIARETLIEQMDDCALVLDAKGRLVDFNQSAQVYLKADPARLGLALQSAMPDLGARLNLAQPDTLDATQLEIVHAGQMMVFETLVTRLVDRQKRVFGRLVLFKNITKRYQAELDLKQRVAEIEELHQNLQQTQELVIGQQRKLATIEAKQQFARNLHDSVSQSIHSLVLFSETLEVILEKENFERARQILPNIAVSARQAHKEIRLLLYGLMEPGLQRGADLFANLEERLRRVENHSGVKGEVTLEGSLEDLPAEWQENLFWMASEALNNSLKHARARSVQVNLRCFPQLVEMEVRDNGIGFDPQKVRRGGLGIENLYARAQQLGGRLTIESEVNKGTRVHFYVQRLAEES